MWEGLEGGRVRTWQGAGRSGGNKEPVGFKGRHATHLPGPLLTSCPPWGRSHAPNCWHFEAMMEKCHAQEGRGTVHPHRSRKLEGLLVNPFPAQLPHSDHTNSMC